MKPLGSVSGTLLALLLTNPINARHAFVSVPSSSHAPFLPSDRTVSPSTARLVLAQRLGVSEYHSVDDADVQSIEILNSFGNDRQESILDGTKQDEERRKVLFFVEGVEDPHNLAHKCSGTKSPSGFRIENPPAADVNLKLLKDLATQSQHKPKLLRHNLHCQGTNFDLPAGLQNEKTSTAGCHTFLHSKLDKTNAGPVTVSNIHTILSDLHTAAKSSSAEVITVFLPPPPSSSLFKRSAAPSNWGTYTLPRQAPAPNKPGKANVDPEHADEVEGDVSSSAPERPSVDEIDEDKPSKDRPVKDKPGKGGEDDPDEDDPDTPKRPSKTPTSSSSSAKETSPPRGILPQCYTSEAECNRATHSCSGHGKCALKFDISHPSDKDGSRAVSTKTKCYSCECDITTRQNEAGGNKTTKWGGPACQKKDVSMEFWLLGTVTVGLVGVIGWAVGLLSSMGSEELPSVIGAGVAGIGARGK